MKRYIAGLMALLCLLAGCAKTPEPAPEPPVQEPPAQQEPVQPAPQPDPQPEPQPQPQPEPIPDPVLPTTVRIVAAGDNLLHNTISMGAQLPDGGYDFAPVYQHITDITDGADLCFVNQEIMLTGEVKGYPRMAAPFQAGDALRASGFNIINLATNHSLDRGEAGLQKCVDYVNTLGFDAVLGAFATPEDAQKPALVEKNGVTFGFLSYTYDFNGYTLSKGNEWKLSQTSISKMKADCAAIRPLCDYLIVSMHWGTEYATAESGDQRNLAQMLCSWGADLIIGTHPHVLQPVRMVEYGGRQAICVYSLGNFISNQHKTMTMLGGMLDLTLEFDETGAMTRIVNLGVIPTVTHYDTAERTYRVWPLNLYTEELVQQHGIHAYAEGFTLDWLREQADRILGSCRMDWQVAG